MSQEDYMSYCIGACDSYVLTELGAATMERGGSFGLNECICNADCSCTVLRPDDSGGGIPDKVTTKTTTFSVPLPTDGAWANIDLSKMSAEELAAGKAALLAAFSSAGGFSQDIVDFINLVQGGKVVDIVAAAADAGLLDGIERRAVAMAVKEPGFTLDGMAGQNGGNRKRRESGAIVADIVFKGVTDSEEAPDFDSMITDLNAAIAAGDVAVTLTVGGEDLPAQFSEAASKSETEETIGGFMWMVEQFLASVGLTLTLGIVILSAAIFVLCCLPIICCCCGCCCCGKSSEEESDIEMDNVVTNQGGFGF